MKTRSVGFVFAAVLLTLTVLGCPGPPGHQGPPGPPGSPGSGSLDFYVAESTPRHVSPGDGVSDSETVTCDAGDAATGWATERGPNGIGSLQVATGALSVVPVLDGTTPTGFSFKFVCTVGDGCPVTYRVICADKTP